MKKNLKSDFKKTASDIAGQSGFVSFIITSRNLWREWKDISREIAKYEIAEKEGNDDVAKKQMTKLVFWARLNAWVNYNKHRFGEQEFQKKLREKILGEARILSWFYSDVDEFRYDLCLSNAIDFYTEIPFEAARQTACQLARQLTRPTYEGIEFRWQRLHISDTKKECEEKRRVKKLVDELRTNYRYAMEDANLPF